VKILLPSPSKEVENAGKVRRLTKERIKFKSKLLGKVFRQ
jgi:hypothetical protein